MDLRIVGGFLLSHSFFLGVSCVSASRRIGTGDFLNSSILSVSGTGSMVVVVDPGVEGG